ncbi:phage portal protein [Bacillus altitudinis]|uniref:XkdQ/YqbQ family protein n=1 Tax=Bacillus altitudinis TaxID=293387 RepID=UPI001933BBB2|nr:phage portal protein [Bacillus altitudinis]MEE3603744.1 phage portal protein [Bacillus altitudinis]MEE3610728.1 phage portal protein [Bacillus altitudinis]MEE3645483.1 phage portal protein [Bacillus altitudinis]MEE4389906.1 phage portal protein [Bacillus altitudinis]MEE4394478.1 phage portal protein [Bacillus altitudinis]
MIELFAIRSGTMYELVTESVTLQGQRYQAPRSIQANIITKQGSQTYYRVSEGDTVLFKWKGKELFRGIVFSRTPVEGKLTFTAYDMLQYLVKNQDVYVFSNQRADQILRRIGADFQIPMTSIANTGHVMKSLVFKNDTSLYDIILKALKETKRQTGRNYQIYSTKGKMGLRAWPDPEDVWVIESGVNLIGYQYSTSIEETATRVKMRTSVDEQGKNKKKGSKSDIVVIEQDKAGQSQYGILQHVETVTGQINQPQLQKRAKVRLAEKKGVKQEVKSIQALGIPELQSGLPIYLKIPEINIKKTYWIDQDKHEFNGVKHTMTIDVVEKNSMPKGDQA